MFQRISCCTSHHSDMFVCWEAGRRARLKLEATRRSSGRGLDMEGLSKVILWSLWETVLELGAGTEVLVGRAPDQGSDTRSCNCACQTL